MVELYKFLGLLALGILFLGLSFLVVKWPQGVDKTFSQHAAKQRFTIYYYVGLFTIVLPLLAVFFVGYFVPTFQLSVWFTICIITSLVAQYLCTLIPEVGGWKTITHQVFAGVSAMLLVPCVAMFLVSDAVPGSKKSLVTASLVFMVTAIVVVFIYRNRLSRALIVQASYFVAFFGAVLAVTL